MSMVDAVLQPDSPTTLKRADVVFTFSYLTWEAAARRGFCHPEDRAARSLLASDRVGHLLVCDTLRSLPVKLIRDRFDRSSNGIAFPEGERARILKPVRLRRNHPATITGVARAFEAYDRALRRAADEMELENPVIITAHPLVAGFSELAWARSVTWYAVDDWAQHPAYRRWWPAYRESYARVRALGRSVAAVSSPLLERLAPTGPGAVIPNGLEPTEWLKVAHPPEWVAGLRRPMLVYAGALDARIDVDWLLRLAGDMPDASIVLVGPLADAGHLAPLRAVRNISFHVPLGRDHVTGLIRAADAGLLPHVDSALTEAMSPLKLYEYLAGGLPVAATDLQPIRSVEDPRVTLVTPRGDYTAGVRNALATGRASEEERVAFVNANSWQRRHERLLELALA